MSHKVIIIRIEHLFWIIFTFKYSNLYMCTNYIYIATWSRNETVFHLVVRRKRSISKRMSCFIFSKYICYDLIICSMQWFKETALFLLYLCGLRYRKLHQYQFLQIIHYIYSVTTFIKKYLYCFVIPLPCINFICEVCQQVSSPTT